MAQGLASLLTFVLTKHGPGIESPGGLVLRLGVQDTGMASRQSSLKGKYKGGAVVAPTVVSVRLREST